MEKSKELITLTPIDPKEAEASISEATGVLKKAEGFVIKAQPDYEKCANSLKIIKGKIKIITEKRKELTSPIDLAKKRVMDLFRPALEAYASAEACAKKLMGAWDAEQDKIYRDQQEKLNLAAQKKEQKRKDRLEERAKEADKAGDTEKAGKLRAERDGVSYQAPVIAPREKTAGVHYKEMWRAEVVDIKKVPRDWLIANQKALDKHAQATKGQIAIPGVEFKSEKVLSSRSA